MHFDMDKILALIKHYAFHSFALVLSLAAIYHTMTQFSDDPLFKYFFGIGGVFAGLAIQYLRGLAAAYRWRGYKVDRGKVIGLWAIVVICIMIFDFTSSFGVLITQIDKGDQQYNQVADVRENLKTDIHKLESDIKTKREQQRIEFEDNKGRGPNYNRFEAEIVGMESKAEGLKLRLSEVKDQAGTLNKSVFARLSEKTGIPSFWIEFVMFTGLMFLIYFIPLLTPWEVTLKPRNDVTASNVTPNKKRNAVTSNAAPPVTSETPRDDVTPVTNETATAGKMTTCACGCGRTFPEVPGKMYYNNNCRVKACRSKSKIKSGYLGMGA